MSVITDVPIAPLASERFADVLEAEAYENFLEGVARGRELLEDRTVWNVNSTARGGGVAEMLISLLAYAKGVGVDARWEVITGNGPFFAITKRIHNNLHGSPGDGGALGEEERELYEQALAPNAAELREHVRPEDVVILHDPQTAGLIPTIKATGAAVIWRCHVGVDTPDEHSRRAWAFLRPYVQQADASVFSREAFVWEDLDDDKIVLIAPSIDAFAPKNEELDPDTVSAILHASGLLDAPGPGQPLFQRVDGSEGRVERQAQLLEAQTLRTGEPYVLQVSRWDALKDPIGVIQGFAEHVAPHTDAHLVYAGPAVDAVSDDPEGAQVLAQAQEYWRSLPDDVKAKIHLAALPMDSLEENAVIVNALQRRAHVVIQKSLAEGFGLTVAEGMWKGRPVVASRIGGIQDQIDDGRSGVLLDDAHDLRAYGAALTELLQDPTRADAIGAAGKDRVRQQFLGQRSLMQYLELIERLLT